MERTQDAFHLKCPKGNQATTICSSSNCSGQSLLCESKQCQCHNPHTHCPISSPLPRLRNCFKKKGRSYQVILTEVYKWYQNQSKLLTVEMEALKRIIDQDELFLLGDEDKLYSLLAEGKSGEITAKLVSDVLKLIDKQPEYDISLKLGQAKKLLQKSETGFQSMMGEIKKLTETSIESLVKTPDITIENTKFAKQLCHQHIALVDKHTARVINYTGNYLTALLEPALPKAGYKSYTFAFKIVKIATTYLMFGACQPTNLNLANDYIYDKLSSGSFVREGSCTYLGNKAGHRKEQKDMGRFYKDDVVEVEYERETEKVTVRNVTRNTSTVSYIKTDGSLPLHVGVLFYDAADEVKVVEVRCVQ